MRIYTRWPCPHSPASDFIEQSITSTDEFSAGDGGKSTADIRRKADGRREWWVGLWYDRSRGVFIIRRVIERLRSQRLVQIGHGNIVAENEGIGERKKEKNEVKGWILLETRNPKLET